MTRIRPVCWAEDLSALAALETGLQTDCVYRVMHGERGFTLREEGISPPLRKGFGAFLEEDAEFATCPSPWWRRRTGR